MHSYSKKSPQYADFALHQNGFQFTTAMLIFCNSCIDAIIGSPTIPTQGVKMSANTIASSNSSAGIIWIKLSVVYLLLGIAMGIGMGASEDFRLHAVHAHINLLGWATMALAGLIYTVFPAAGESKLAKVHFWALNIALPVMMATLTMLLLGNPKVIPVLASAEMLAAAGVLSFAINIFMNLKKA
jgi:hypothetical protein